MTDRAVPDPIRAGAIGREVDLILSRVGNPLPGLRRVDARDLRTRVTSGDRVQVTLVNGASFVGFVRRVGWRRLTITTLRLGDLSWSYDRVHAVRVDPLRSHAR